MEKRVPLGVSGVGWGRGTSVLSIVFLFNAWVQVTYTEQWALALAYVTIAIAFVANDPLCESFQAKIRWLAVVIAVAGVVVGVVRAEWLGVALSGLLVLLWTFLLITGRSQIEIGRKSFPTEDLVGLTVPEALHRVGFDEHREPGGLVDPVLVATPPADLDLASPSLIVTSVAVDEVERTMTFGVAQPEQQLAPQDREELQRLLVEQVGGYPADVLPLRKADPLSRYRPRFV
jgi:hypothetical protein